MKQKKECRTNDKSPQIGVYYYSVEINGNVYESYKVEVVQENDIGWINFEYYNLDGAYLIERFDAIEESLIRAWEASWYK